MARKRKPLEGDWVGIACLCVYQLAGGEATITRKDLGALPMDRVLWLETTDDGERVHFSWLKPAVAATNARLVAIKTGGKDRTGVSELQGHYEKIACVLLWRFARDGCVLTARDRDDLPSDQVMLTYAHGDTVELRFVKRAEAARIQRVEQSLGRIVPGVFKQ